MWHLKTPDTFKSHNYRVKVPFEAALVTEATVGLDGQSSGMCMY